MRKHFFRYELRMRATRVEGPLRFGAAYHNALELLDKSNNLRAACQAVYDNYADRPDDIEEMDWLVEREMVLRLVLGHTGRWVDDGIKVVATEKHFTLPLRNPNTGTPSKNFKLAGKIDRIVRLPDGRLAVQEYKTTSKDICAGSSYWQRLRIDGQISLYMLACRELGYDVDAVLYDVVRKPTIRPRRLTKQEVTAFKQSGMWHGEAIVNQFDGTRESPQMYGARLSADIAGRPDHYFARQEIPRLDSDLAEFAAELWQFQKTLREAQKHGRWYRNPDACMRWGRPCEYFDLCINGVDPVRDGVPDGFAIAESAHPELIGS